MGVSKGEKEKREASIGIRVWPSLKQIIDELAREENRTTAQYIETMLIERAKEKGKWPK